MPETVSVYDHKTGKRQLMQMLHLQKMFEVV